MKLYRVFGGLHYRGSMFQPFFETNWTPSKAKAKGDFKRVTLNDFIKEDIDIEIIERHKDDQLPAYLDKPSPETMFLWIELAEVTTNRKRMPANDDILEIADYDQKELSERGLWLNGRKMSPKTFKKIIYDT